MAKKKQSAADKAFIKKVKSITVGTGAKPEADTFMGIPTKIKCPKCGKAKHLAGVSCTVIVPTKKHYDSGEESFSA